jgi:hypothetical protein
MQSSSHGVDACGAAQSGVQIGQRRGHGAGLRIEPLAKIERGRGPIDIVQIGTGAGGVACSRKPRWKNGQRVSVWMPPRPSNSSE